MSYPGAASAVKAPEATEMKRAELYRAGLAARICGRGALALALALCCAPALARAQVEVPGPGKGETAPSAASEAAARAHFLAGVEHYRARRYRDAIRELQVSRSQVANPEIWFNIGRAHEQLGELQLAVDHYRSYLRELPSAKDTASVGARIDELEQRIEAAAAAMEQKGEARPGSIVLEVTPPDAHVRLDGELVEGGAGGQVLSVAPGVRSLDAEAPGFGPLHARVDVEAGGLRAAYLELEPLGARDDRASSRTWVWIAAGLAGVAGLSAGALAAAGAIERDASGAASARPIEQAAAVSLGGALAFALVATLLDLSDSDSASP